MQKLIILRGYPGSGKTTLGKLLMDRKHGTFIDHNQILTFIANITGDDEGIYNEIHLLEQAMARKLLGSGVSVIVARGFSSHESIEPYLGIASETGSTVKVIQLDAPQDVLETRVQAPERKNDFNPTVSPDVLKEWISKNPLDDIEGQIVVDASQPLDVVIANTEEILA